MKVQNIERPAAAYMEDSRYWHEGVRCVGYLEDAKSYVFLDRGHYFCISGGFLKSVYAGKTGQGDG